MREFAEALAALPEYQRTPTVQDIDTIVDEEEYGLNHDESMRYETFAASVLQILNAGSDEEGVDVDVVMAQINVAGQQYSEAERDDFLRIMEEQNQVMYEAGFLY